MAEIHRIEGPEKPAPIHVDKGQGSRKQTGKVTEKVAWGKSELGNLARPDISQQGK